MMVATQYPPEALPGGTTVQSKPALRPGRKRPEVFPSIDIKAVVVGLVQCSSLLQSISHETSCLKIKSTSSSLELDLVSRQPTLADAALFSRSKRTLLCTAGLFLATQLSKLKINTRIVDKAAHPVLRGHADGISASPTA